MKLEKATAVAQASEAPTRNPLRKVCAKRLALFTKKERPESRSNKFPWEEIVYSAGIGAIPASASPCG